MADNSVKWDASVTSDAQAVKKYGEGATSIGKEVEYYAENGRSVALHDGGKWNYTDDSVSNAGTLPELSIGTDNSGNGTGEESGPRGTAIAAIAVLAADNASGVGFLMMLQFRL